MEKFASKMVISYIKWSFLTFDVLKVHGVRREECVLFPMYDVTIIRVLYPIFFFWITPATVKYICR